MTNLYQAELRVNEIRDARETKARNLRLVRHDSEITETAPPARVGRTGATRRALTRVRYLPADTDPGPLLW